MTKFLNVEDKPLKTKSRSTHCTRCGKPIKAYVVFRDGWTFCDMWCEDMFFKAEGDQK